MAMSTVTNASDEELEEQMEALRGAAPVDKGVYIAIYLCVSAAVGVVGTLTHGLLLQRTAEVLSLKAVDDGSEFETSFFGLLSIVYGLFTGQTFLFLYERQVIIVQELYSEVFALEMLIQKMFVSTSDVAVRREMATCIRNYMKEELYNPTDAESPFSQESTYMAIIFLIEAMQDRGMNVKGLVSASKLLADAQSRRSAVAAQILPLVHWVFIHAMEAIFVFTFLLFDAAELFGEGSTSTGAVPAERSLLFGALLALLTLTAQVLHDLEDPFEGMYSFKLALDDRVAFAVRKITSLEVRPGSYVPRSVAAFYKLGMMGEEADSDATRRDFTKHVPPPQIRRKGRRRRRKLLPYADTEESPEFSTLVDPGW